MMTTTLIVILSLGYLGMLFAIAYWADRRADQNRSVISNATIYALSLAVYCTAWTFYGSVGRAAATGVGFLPIYLGPTLIAALWGTLLLKMVRVSKSQRITSIADFIASRYGKSHLLGGIVTIIAVLGIVPYIALQLKAISRSFTILLTYPEVTMPNATDSLPLLQDTTLYVALLLALFTILFGTRHLDASERHEGMVAAIAFESIVKLVAFIAVGLFVTFQLHDGFTDLFDKAETAGILNPLIVDGMDGYENWFSLTLLSALAVMMLPRQFQVAVVENSSEHHLRRAIWLFPLYLFLINIFVIPIALAGQLTFAGADVDADTFVLTLPMAYHQSTLTLLAFLGGLSAATGMVIVETIALSTMVCNDLVMPGLLRRWKQIPPNADLSQLLLRIRRGAILLILLLGFLYFRLAGEAYALVSIGLISFSAVAQFAPAMIMGLYWRGGTRDGALAGLLTGFSIWIYTLLLPSFAKSGWLPVGLLEDGPFGIELLKPQALFGLTGLNEITHCLFWSMTLNIGTYILFSFWRTPGVNEATQATLFVDALKHQRFLGVGLWRGTAEIDELLHLAERFLGASRAQALFQAYATRRKIQDIKQLPADAETVHFAETLLAGAIGSASARVMVSSVTAEESLGMDEVLNILDEASQIRAYSHELEKKSQELAAATRELKEANERLQELDRVKDDFMSSVTHELRTPLASIRAFSEILNDDPEIELNERRRFLGIIVSETKRLSRLVNQVLDLAKIESGRADWNAEDVDLLEVVEQALASTEQLFAERGTQVIRETPNSACMVTGDRDRLMQVLVNLLSNANKFVSEKSGIVCVGLHTYDDRYEISVADNGTGIAAEELPNIFEKFRQAGTVSNKPIGTGLGLPISKRIIEHLGGRLWAESDAENGAIFTFAIPKKQNDALPPGETHAEKDSDRG
ncbi:MAG: histidine kinase [Candidatus Thiodiazotropha sp. (ex Rostrolucina anterorostrata)]|nr:histidine kinase [Candidatus Thiodiazotropha sp. (ex Rostrolucina anterorostrata)]